MRNIVHAVLLSVLAVGIARAQTPGEQEAIISQFERAVTAYTQSDCSGGSTLPPSEAIFTLPVSMVFRQRIAQVVGGSLNGQTMTAANTPSQEPLSLADSVEVPGVLKAVLPPLPPGLEYRFAQFDLVLRDTERNVVVAVLRDAVRHSSAASTNRRQQ